MTVLRGEGVSSGIASGKLIFLRRDAPSPVRREINDPETEISRFNEARNEAIRQLSKLYAESRAVLGDEHALLFEIHKMMLDDLDYRESVEGLIRSERVNAEYAVAQTASQFADMFRQMDDLYMRERSADVLDVSARVVRLLAGEEVSMPKGSEPFILAADDLAPSETARLDRGRILAFVTMRGSKNSHTAIFARTMGIPAVVELGNSLNESLDGKSVFVDGEAGTVYIEPDPKTESELRSRAHAAEERRRYFERFRGLDAYSPSGRRVLLGANIGSPQDLNLVLAAGADAIGLFRSEFLYLGRDAYPSEDEQFDAYRKAAEAMAGRTVVIRTLDIGADKQAKYFELPQEENPALGMRAIRICLTRPEVFKTQLRALYRASAYGNIAIMFPMIASVEEVRRAKEYCAQVCSELKSEGIAFNSETQVGIMIETPAAAIISDILAPEVDFFSIGTNDLTQYTLAADRQNEAVQPFCDVHHEAVLRLIRMTVENAHKSGIWAGICGELAADTALTDTFMEIGVDELSMPPGNIPEIRAKILDR